MRIWIKSIANHPCFRYLHQFLDKLIVNSFLDEKTRSSHTNFSLKKKLKARNVTLLMCLRYTNTESEWEVWVQFTLLYKIPIIARGATLSTSTSSNTIKGDLPPNSSETGFKLLSAAACITRRPTSVEPVKLIWIKHTIISWYDSPRQYSSFHLTFFFHVN